MRKNILIFLLLASNYCNAQYFIPLFKETIDTMDTCPFIISDTSNNYLLLFVRDSSSNEFLDGYRDNQLYATNFPLYESSYVGCQTESGLVAINNHTDHTLFTIDSLNYQPCFYGFCNVSNISAMASKNDTIYYNANLFGHDFIFGNTPSGTSFQIGDATGGAGISDLEFYNGYLYACGSFTEMDGDASLNYLCYWDGTSWHPVNQLGIDSVNGSQITSIIGYGSMEVLNGNLIIDAGADLQSGNNTNLLVELNVNSCSTVSGLYNNGAGGLYSDLINYHNKIYLLGFLVDSVSNFAGLCDFDGSKIKFYYEIPFFYPVTAAVFNDTLFIGGNFNNIGYVPAKNVAKFVDNSFSSFAPVGTKWWYNSSDSAYKYFEVTRDTFIMHTANYYGYNCRKIMGEQHEHDSIVTQLEPMYVFGDTNRVMYYNNYRGRFVSLYNFNVSTGDTLNYYTPQPQTTSDTTFRVVVDSITQLNIQGTNCKRVWSTPLDGWSFGNDGYVQLVGGMGSMLPQPINYYNTEGPLRCYEDTSVFYHYLVNINCEQLDTATGIDQLIMDNGQLIIYPNPANETLTLTANNIMEVVVFNLLGEKVQSSNYKVQCNTATIDISKLPQGIYLLRVQTNDGWRVGKLVKE